jgi:endonuclease/exonuclease/phosphatase family metal-dependent hydrolase
LDQERRQLRDESHALKRAIGRFATRRAWLGSAEGPRLAERLARHLGRVRRHEPRGAPAPPTRDWLLAVHWNVLHGGHYERVLGALRQEPALAGADLVSLNETDLGLARSGNRDVAFELAAELGLHGAWAPLFLELEAGHKTPPAIAALEQEESLFGVALLSRFPLGRLARVELASPADLLFDRERRAGSFVALVAEVLDPRGPFRVAVTHLDVHRSPEHRLAQVEEILGTVPAGPALLAGDLNTTTFRRGTWARSARALALLAAAPRGRLRRQLLAPHLPAGAAREPLFDALRRRGFAIEPFNDASPSLDLRFADVGEIELLPPALRRAALRALRHVERRAALRLDWIAARGFIPAPERRPFTLTHLMRGPDAASDHAPIGCGLRRG